MNAVHVKDYFLCQPSFLHASACRPMEPWIIPRNFGLGTSYMSQPLSLYSYSKSTKLRILMAISDVSQWPLCFRPRKRDRLRRRKFSSTNRDGGDQQLVLQGDKLDHGEVRQLAVASRLPSSLVFLSSACQPLTQSKPLPSLFFLTVRQAGGWQGIAWMSLVTLNWSVATPPALGRWCLLYNPSPLYRTWWNQITTPTPTSTTTKPTTTYKPQRAKTTMPWWKRLQQKTLSQRQEKEKKEKLKSTKNLFLTTSSSRTTSTTPIPPPTPPPPTTTTTEVSVFKDKNLDTASKQKQSDLVHLNTLGQYECIFLW